MLWFYTYFYTFEGFKNIDVIHSHIYFIFASLTLEQLYNYPILHVYD